VYWPKPWHIDHGFGEGISCIDATMYPEVLVERLPVDAGLFDKFIVGQLAGNWNKLAEATTH